MKCPTCKRKLKDAPETCQRCGTELTGLYELAKKSLTEIRRGKALLIQQKASDALLSFQKADNMKKSRQAQKGIVVTLAATGQFESALKYFLRIHQTNSDIK